MLFKSAISVAVALLSAHQTMGAAMPAVTEAAVDSPITILVATDPYFACNCPNNCSYRAGHSCRYYTGPSDNSPIAKGTCVSRDNQLVCIA